MKRIKLLLTVITVLCMTFILCTGACAVDLDDPRFLDKSWEDVMNDFLAAKGLDSGQITAGYYNTVTGELNFHNPDQIMYGASVAKLPTNMLFAERVSKGEMTMDTLIRGNRYESIQHLSIVNSDNPAMDVMVKELGGGNYTEFRKKILPYIGETEDSVDQSFLSRNYLTARQVMYTLQLLYGNAETYPGVEEKMLLASPYDYFKGNQPPYSIAHKYGWYTDHGTEYMNDSAIIYTDDPILLVMFTAAVKENRYVLADFCSLMCDYAQYHRALRYAEEAAAQTDLTIETAPAFLGRVKTAAPPAGYSVWQAVILGAAFIALIITAVLLMKKKLSAIIFMVVAVLLTFAGVAPTALAYLTVRNGSALTVPYAFTEAFANDTRGTQLVDSCDYAMAHSEGTSLNDIVTEMFSESFTLTATEAERTGNYIKLSVIAQKADTHAVAEALTAQWSENLKAAVENAEPAALYDDAGCLNESIVQTVTEQTLNTIEQQWNSFLYTREGTIYLKPMLEGFSITWKIVCTDEFLSLVNYE